MCPELLYSCAVTSSCTFTFSCLRRAFCLLLLLLRPEEAAPSGVASLPPAQGQPRDPCTEQPVPHPVQGLPTLVGSCTAVWFGLLHDLEGWRSPAWGAEAAMCAASPPGTLAEGLHASGASSSCRSQLDKEVVGGCWPWTLGLAFGKKGGINWAVSFKKAALVCFANCATKEWWQAVSQNSLESGAALHRGWTRREGAVAKGQHQSSGQGADRGKQQLAEGTRSVAWAVWRGEGR